MTHNLVIDVSHLEEDERDYENNIRSDYQQPRQALLMSPLGILASWLEHERALIQSRYHTKFHLKI